TRSTVRRLVVAMCAALLGGLFWVAPAQAHPLGNLSINHLDSLQFGTTRIVDDAIVDTAEIPTAQAADQVDANGDGTASASELERYGVAQCAAYLATLTLTVDDRSVDLSTSSTAFAYRPGQAGLQTTRLECRFEAQTDLSIRRRVTFSNHFASDRVGWHEIVAVGEGSTLAGSTVPTNSVTEGLTKYPLDLLSSPVDVRDADFDIAPGASAQVRSSSTKQSASTFSRAIGPFSGAVERVNRVFNDLVGRRQLTLGVGLLAIGLALVLGASHALLPGHGKTVMAAYIAGRQGSVRDAVLVGATVTATHTGGVLVLGLALTVSTSLAGESVLAWLGVISGLLIAGLGAGLVRSAGRHTHGEHDGHGHRHGFGHSHSHTTHVHDHPHAEHAHPHGDHSHHGLALDLPRIDLAGPSSRQALVLATRWDANGSVALAERPVDTSAFAVIGKPNPSDAPPVHRDHVHDAAVKNVSRRGLVGMGIAGGLVPSPSALVVLLSAIALGRTVFGIILVIGYGVGMAGTLTLAGVLLVRVRDRYRDRPPAERGRLRMFAARWTRLAPYFTAALVFVVGLGLAFRSLGSI
ncbi:MAG: hypothetical protein ABIZ69_04040, partial [Ilumatobacteraceae bacterium]